MMDRRSGRREESPSACAGKGLTTSSLCWLCLAKGDAIGDRWGVCMCWLTMMSK